MPSGQWTSVEHSVPARPLRNRLTVPACWRLLGLLVFAVASVPVVDKYLVHWPDEIWQVDLEVYREGARGLVIGRPVYDFLTSAPQYLPMTYPPFAAVLGTPLLLVPFRVAGWMWTFFQLWLLWVTVGMGFRPLLARFSRMPGLVQGALAGALVQLQPVAEGIRFGQVNAILVALCLADAVRPREGFWPRGSLVGIATAIKLTPGVFWVHWAVVRRWRVLAVSVATTLTVTGLTALLLPAASSAFWTEALRDPGRLGPNAGTANQSIRGVLLRVGPPEGPALTLTWLALVLVVGVGGFALSARLYRLGEHVAVVGVVGMLAVLISPVSWVHHLHWGIVVIAALLGDGRQWRRVVAALLAYWVLWTRLPWVGGSWVQQGHGPYWYARFLESSYAMFAVAALVVLWWLLARGREPAAAGSAAGSAEGSAAGTDRPLPEAGVQGGRPAGS